MASHQENLAATAAYAAARRRKTSRSSSRPRTRSGSSSLPGTVEREYIYLERENDGLRAQLHCYHRYLKYALACIALLFFLVCLPSGAPAEVAHRVARADDPPYFTNGTNKYSALNNGLLIPAKRRNLYTRLDVPYENLTLAHFGWVHRSPFKALNYDQRLRVAYLTGPGAEFGIPAFHEYIEYLKRPWRSDGPLCDPKTGVFDPVVCKQAVETFEANKKCFLDEEEKCLTTYKNTVWEQEALEDGEYGEFYFNKTKRYKEVQNEWSKMSFLSPLLGNQEGKDIVKLDGRNWNLFSEIKSAEKVEL